MRIALVAALSTIAVALGCSTPVEPTFTRMPGTTIDRSNPVFVATAEQQDRVIQALKANGFATSRKPVEGGYVLRVLFGDSRATKECGTLSNVIFTLYSSAGVAAGYPLAQIKARDYSGSCEPNVLDAMAAKLASVAS